MAIVSPCNIKKRVNLWKTEALCIQGVHISSQTYMGSTAEVPGSSWQAIRGYGRAGSRSFWPKSRFQLTKILKTWSTCWSNIISETNVSINTTIAYWLTWRAISQILICYCCERLQIEHYHHPLPFHMPLWNTLHRPPLKMR